jgi:hypothetical protein
LTYTINETNKTILLDAGTTETSLLGLSLIEASFGSPVVITSGGDHGGHSGTQKVYTLAHPYTLQIEGHLTITPDIEQLVIENTAQVDNQQDFRIGSGGFVTIAGEINEAFGTYYSPATWIRINRQSNDSFRPSKSCFYIHPLGGMDWRGGVAEAAAVFAIEGDFDETAPSITISNATWRGLSGDMFNISDSRLTYFPDAFTIMGNRLSDGRDDTYMSSYRAVDSLIEGGTNQTYENYSGVVEYATWTRNLAVRTFVNSDFGMLLPVRGYDGNWFQQGGLIKVTKNVSLNIVDTERNPLNDVKVAVKAYDNGDRINYPALDTASIEEQSIFPNQEDVADILDTTDESGVIYFEKLLKEYTGRHNLTSFSVGANDVTGNFTSGDSINVDHTSPTRSDGEFVYHDTVENKIYFRRTRNYKLFYGFFQRMVNLSQTGQATWDTVNINHHDTNNVARFTNGGDDYNPVGDVLTFKYGKRLTATELNYGGMNTLDATVFMIDDPFITEPDFTVASSYTVLENVNKVYDYLTSWLWTNWQQEEEFPYIFAEGYLAFENLNLVLDGTQSVPLTISGDTLTLGVGTSSRFVGDLKASNITLVNGASTSGLLNSDGDITYPSRVLTLTGLQPNSEVRVYESGTSNEVAGAENSGVTFSDETIEVDSVDVVVHHVTYEHIRIINVDTTSNLTLPIQQRFDRGYSNA